MKYALDSNTVSYLLRKNPQVENKIKETVDNGNEYILPPMVYYEVKRWLKLKNATAQLAIFGNLCQFTKIIEMDIHTFEKAIEIYIALAKNGNLIGDTDILIAAFCVVNGYTLVTNNTGEFSRISDLKLENWIQ